MACSTTYSIFAVISVALSITLVFADEQYITLFEDPDSQGSPLTIEEKLSNFTPEVKDFMRNASSYCAVGWWVGYSNPEFNIDGGVGVLLDQSDGAPRCNNRVFINFNSLRYLGSGNTDVPSIAFYSKASYHGLELLINEDDGPSVNTTFTPLSYVTTGFSNWTVYDGPGLTGSSWCIQSTKKVTLVSDVNATWPAIGSLAPGCNV